MAIIFGRGFRTQCQAYFSVLLDIRVFVADLQRLNHVEQTAFLKQAGLNQLQGVTHFYQRLTYVLVQLVEPLGFLVCV